jgi:hypothetical protein
LSRDIYRDSILAYFLKRAGLELMDLVFEHGDHAQPKGHAIIYFRSGSEILVSYIVVLPLTVDFAKYIPPVLASQVNAQGMEQFSAFAIPPIPENVHSYEFIDELSKSRSDDLIAGGEVVENDSLGCAQRVNDAVEAYTKLYHERATLTHEIPSIESNSSDLNVGEVLFSMMSEKDKLGELAKLVGKLQFAIEGNDSLLLLDVESEIHAFARHLPENYHVSRLIEVAKESVNQEPKLAQLYLERCYKLANNDYIGLQQVDTAIEELQSTRDES